MFHLCHQNSSALIHVKKKTRELIWHHYFCDFETFSSTWWKIYLQSNGVIWIILTSSRVEYTVFGIIGSKFGLYIVNNGDWKGISTFRYLFEIQSQMQINITLVVEFQRWWVLKNKIFSYKWSDLKDFFWLFEMKEHGARSLRSSKKWVSMLLHFKKSNEILETWSPHCKNLVF